ncbi:flavin monoamine oxidase family protein [Dactylosporangium sp. NPDC000521]|uniref:flavin monoamine oxidase family protein n=1 Tax=Dactylosporangium sp. NPDC000521 TaxID=3363975 RepID=UPI0036BC4F82
MTFFTTNRSSEPNQNVQRTFVDVLYDHTGYLEANGGRLGPAGALNGRSVAVIGAGMAGLMAAYLLDQQGAKVTIYEASEHAGGRVRSVRPVPGDPAIFEMGAMRVPPSEQLFNYYAAQFGIKPGGQFPDPGKVNTNIIFQGGTYEWAAGLRAPAIFDNVSAGWDALAGYWTKHIGDNLADPSRFVYAQSNWQSLIYPYGPSSPEQGYSQISFYQGLVQAFVENAARWNTSPWTSQDFALFGALGLGSGGFGPLYPVNFAEIARLVVNGLETDQQFYPSGLGGIADGFVQRLRSSQIQFRTRVTGVAQTGDRPTVTFLPPNATRPATASFDAVVVATTTRSMEVDMGISSSPDWVLPDATGTALREIHLMNSSKLFVLTKRKFWQGTDLPQNIQTDGLCRGLYCLDYPDSDYGVVLISYTWGDDSTKYIALRDPRQRLETLLDSLAPGAPKFVRTLREQIVEDRTAMVDWQMEPQFYGAFKLNYPGQDTENADLYYQFLDESPAGIYLAGDSVGWCGGWIEGALQTGVNAAAAVANRIAGPGGLFPGSPMTQTSNRYTYGN